MINKSGFILCRYEDVEPRAGQLRLLENSFYSNANWEQPLRLQSVPGPETIRLFDQNGYRLTDLEVLYAEANQQLAAAHRTERVLKKDWFLH